MPATIFDDVAMLLIKFYTLIHLTNFKNIINVEIVYADFEEMFLLLATMLQCLILIIFD